MPADSLVRFEGNRFYNLMGGEDEREGGALHFFNLNRPLDFSGTKREYPSPMKFLVEPHQKGAWAFDPDGLRLDPVMLNLFSVAIAKLSSDRAATEKAKQEAETRQSYEELRKELDYLDKRDSER